MRAVVVGSTGGVGRWTVAAAARDERVASVTAVVRDASRVGAGTSSGPASDPATAAAEYFHLNGDEDARRAFRDKVKVASVADLSSAEEVDRFVASAGGFDVVYTCIGIYTAQAKDEQHFRSIEVELNTNLAKAFQRGGAKRLAYLSGAGASQTGSMMMFARVKGDAEKSLQSLGFERAVVARPGGIYNRDAPSLPWIYEFVNARLLPARFSIDAADIARAMVHATLRPELPGESLEKAVLENLDLKREARAYDELLAKVGGSPF